MYVFFSICFVSGRVLCQLFRLNSLLNSDIDFIVKLIEYLIQFTKPSARAGCDTRSIFKQSFAGLNSEFSFSETSCLTKAEEPSPSYYLPIAGGRIIRFIPFPRVLVLCEMESVSSRIWTCVAVFIFYNDNHYTTGNLIEYLIVTYCKPTNVLDIDLIVYLIMHSIVTYILYFHTISHH